MDGDLTLRQPVMLPPSCSRFQASKSGAFKCFEDIGKPLVCRAPVFDT